VGELGWLLRHPSFPSAVSDTGLALALDEC
jgi:hypothetical protein